MTFNHNCKFCEYKWAGRKEQPISCPRCKRRFDYSHIHTQPASKAVENTIKE